MPTPSSAPGGEDGATRSTVRVALLADVVIVAVTIAAGAITRAR